MRDEESAVRTAVRESLVEEDPLHSSNVMCGESGEEGGGGGVRRRSVSPAAVFMKLRSQFSGDWRFRVFNGVRGLVGGPSFLESLG